MILADQTRQQVYESQVKTFAGNRSFQFLTIVKVKRGYIHCDACGSKLVQELRLIQDSNGNYFLIGSNCYTVLYNEQKIIWGLYQHTPQESQMIAERLIAERKSEVPKVDKKPSVIFNPDSLTTETVDPEGWYITQQERTLNEDLP